jgi:hypothetical protein
LEGWFKERLDERCAERIEDQSIRRVAISISWLECIVTLPCALKGRSLRFV